MESYWHVIPVVQGDPEFGSLESVGLELVFVDDVIGVDDDEHDVDAMNQLYIHASDIGKNVFILESASSHIAGI